MGVGRGSVVPLIFELEFGDGGWNVPRGIWIEGRIGTGGDAAAHPVFCLLNLFLPCHVYALLAHTPLAARRPTTDTTASGGALGTPAHDSLCPSDVVGRCGRIRNVRSLL